MKACYSMDEIYDVAIIGAGVIGCNVARQLSGIKLRCALWKQPDVAMGASSANGGLSMRAMMRNREA